MAKYDNEFKKEIAKLVHNKIKSRSEIKREYGITPSTVVGWEKQFFGELKKRDDLSSQELKIIKLKKLLKEKKRKLSIIPQNKGFLLDSYSSMNR